jgi:hypothetical protein
LLGDDDLINRVIKEKNYRNYFLYAFDKDAVKKKYLKDSTLKRKRKVYIS